jgi:hypothetical protein
MLHTFCSRDTYLHPELRMIGLGAPASRRLIFSHFNHSSPISKESSRSFFVYSEIAGIRICEPARRRRSQGVRRNTMHPKISRHLQCRAIIINPFAPYPICGRDFLPQEIYNRPVQQAKSNKRD